MDEGYQLLGLVIEQLEQMRGEICGLRTMFQSLLRGDGAPDNGFWLKTDLRLLRIEDRLDHLAIKWMEHDQAIHEVCRRQAQTLLD